ncbi:copper ion binding protein [Shouchella shacheensis]|uniref:copper ion binding protein n=1 Tax=Shouchella shacheensis TaxID=1649580 RepID=UPI000B019704
MNQTFSVQGMSCNHCVHSIEESAGKLTGVDSVKVDLQSGQVEVSFDENAISLQMIKEELSKVTKLHSC